jgi:acyl-CoA oxidase
VTTRTKATNAASWTDPATQLAALRHVAAKLALNAADVLRAAGNGKFVFEGAPWNNSTVDLIRVARAHCCLVVHQWFVDAVAEARGQLSPQSAAVLATVAALHGVTLLCEAQADLLEGGHVTAPQVRELRAQKRFLVRALRPDAVSLVDAFGYEDYVLNSAIGRKDGDVYRALLDAARMAPLNATDEGPAWKPVLEGLLNPEARQARSRL